MTSNELEEGGRYSGLSLQTRLFTNKDCKQRVNGGVGMEYLWCYFLVPALVGRRDTAVTVKKMKVAMKGLFGKSQKLSFKLP